MADIARQLRPHEAGGLAGVTGNPIVAGGLAVGIVALLVVSARVMLESSWGQTLGFWVLGGTAAFFALGWGIAARLRTRREPGVAHLQASSDAAGRGVRRHRRYVPANRVTALYTQNGRRIGARIVNISVAAVAVEAKMSDLDYMSVLRVGAREVAPIRRTPAGAVFSFKTILDPQQLDRSFEL